MWTTVDLEDLDRVLNFDYSWHSGYRAKTKSYYAKANVYTGEKVNEKWKYYTLYLQQFLLGIEGRKVDVDHINHDTLDNRKENLRVSYRKSNSKNRNGKNINNKSGYRNVSYIPSNGNKKYIVQLMINGKNTRLKSFSNADEAGAYAEQMREKYYGEYAGENERVTDIA